MGFFFSGNEESNIFDGVCLVIDTHLKGKEEAVVRWWRMCNCQQ